MVMNSRGTDAGSFGRDGCFVEDELHFDTLLAQAKEKALKINSWLGCVMDGFGWEEILKIEEKSWQCQKNDRAC